MTGQDRPRGTEVNTLSGGDDEGRTEAICDKECADSTLAGGSVVKSDMEHARDTVAMGCDCMVSTTIGVSGELASGEDCVLYERSLTLVQHIFNMQVMRLAKANTCVSKQH